MRDQLVFNILKGSNNVIFSSRKKPMKPVHVHNVHELVCYPDEAFNNKLTFMKGLIWSSKHERYNPRQTTGASLDRMVMI